MQECKECQDYQPYHVEFLNDDIISIVTKFNTYKMHLPTNFPNYERVPPSLFKKTNFSLIDNSYGNPRIEYGIPILMENWNRGNFIQDNYREICRLEQYEFDKACFRGELKDKKEVNDNAAFFLYAQKILKKLNP